MRHRRGGEREGSTRQKITWWPASDDATSRSYGLAEINDSVMVNDFNSRSVGQDGVLGFQPGCGSLFRLPVNTNEPFASYK